MKRIAFVSLAVAAQMAAAPAFAVTNDNGDVLISQAAVNAGNITPGDTPGFPVTISVPGTYRLASNLTVTTAVNGIEVRANEVAIEMGGRTLAGSGVGRNGIASFNRNLRIEGGTVRGFTLDGIRTIAQFLTVRDMVVTGNGRAGVFADSGFNAEVTVAFASVIDSKVTNNRDSAIICGSSCVVQNSIASFNNQTGIYLKGQGGVILGNSATANSGFGIYLIGSSGVGNNTVLDNNNGQIVGPYVSMQPNACVPACP